MATERTERFSILGIDVEILGPAEIVDPIGAAYRRFATSAVGDDAICLHADLDGGLIRANGEAVPLVASWNPLVQVYQQLLFRLMDRIDSWAVLHAAALADRAGGAVILAAPSGHGKTSLTLELARRGLGFLSDDFAPLGLSTREVAPYPRAVAVIPRPDAPIPAPFRSLALDPTTARLFEKSLIDVGDALGDSTVQTAPIPLRHVILLTADAPGAEPAATWVTVGTPVERADALEARLAAVAGVDIVHRHGLPPVTLLTFKLDHQSGPTAEVSRILDGSDVLYFEKRWEGRPDFTAKPSAEPIRRREAAEALGREMLNRRPAGRLLASYGGSVGALFVDLAGALRDAECHSVRVGELGATADLVEKLLDVTTARS